MGKAVMRELTGVVEVPATEMEAEGAMEETAEEVEEELIEGEGGGR